MWNAIIDGVSPHLIAGGIMVAVMGAMLLMHRWRGSKPKPSGALEILRERFARGEIDQDEYEKRRKVLTT
jgi:putative membrane protein